MSDINIDVSGGSSVKLLTAGKYCDRNIVVTASGGNITPSDQRKDVSFIDYDGTLLYSYTVEEAQALTQLPDLPSHDGLICQGWNWTLEDIKDMGSAVTVGATYITDDGKTRIYITLPEGRTSPMLGCCPAGTVTVDWGDGTESDVLTGSNTTTVKWTPNHNYEKAGDYVITLTVDGAMGFYGTTGTNQYSGILRYTSAGDGRNHVYQNSVIKIEIGDNVSNIGTYAFRNCYSLESIVIPNSIISIDNYALQNCYSLDNIVIPNSVTTIGTSAFDSCSSLVDVSISNRVMIVGSNSFQGCHSLVGIVIPNSTTNIGSGAFQDCHSLANIVITNETTSIGSMAFYNCYSLVNIVIPDGITNIDSSVFYSCYSVSTVVIPSSVTSIDTRAFYGCTGASCYDFTSHTTVPSLANTNAFNSIPADCTIKVPVALYDQWVSETNWSTYASQIVGV